jgi:dihydroneopterin aldolase
MTKPDHLHLHGLSVATHIGVPAEERRVPQRLKLNLTLWPQAPLTGLRDDFALTVDYGAVALLVRELAAARPRLLIETLAEEVADALLLHFPLREVQVEVEKFILPDTDFVRVSLTKAAPAITS